MEMEMEALIARAEVPANMKWKITGPPAGSPLRTGVKVALYGDWIARYLQYEHQRWGINLGWTDDASAQTATASTQWEFVAAAGSADIKYGDFVAFRNHKVDDFVVNGQRTLGVNLDWSNEPVREWMIIGGPKGKAVTVGSHVSLFNTKCKLPLIYFDRTVGGSLGWPDSKTWGAQAIDKIGDKIKDQLP